jgi:hypothetical protein
MHFLFPFSSSGSVMMYVYLHVYQEATRLSQLEAVGGGGGGGHSGNSLRRLGDHGGNRASVISQQRHGEHANHQRESRQDFKKDSTRQSLDGPGHKIAGNSCLVECPK